MSIGQNDKFKLTKRSDILKLTSYWLVAVIHMSSQNERGWLLVSGRTTCF